MAGLEANMAMRIVKPGIKITLIAMTIAICGCNRTEADRTASVPYRGGQSTEVPSPAVTLSAAPAPPERGPPQNVNQAPGTDASQAFANNPPVKTSLPPSKGGSPEDQQTNVAAQDAAAKAPDTASADAAKHGVQEQRNGQ